MGRPVTYKTPAAKAAAYETAQQRYRKTAKFKATQARYLAKRDPRTKRTVRLRHLFGITADQWDAMFAAQGERCRACGSATPNHKNGWATDHCHKTGVVRGILCQPCNLIAGLARDNPAHCEAVRKYLELAVKSGSDRLEQE